MKEERLKEIWEKLPNKYKSLAQNGILDFFMIGYFDLWTDNKRIAFIDYAKKQPTVLYYEPIKETA